MRWSVSCGKGGSTNGVTSTFGGPGTPFEVHQRDLETFRESSPGPEEVSIGHLHHSGVGNPVLHYFVRLHPQLQPISTRRKVKPRYVTHEFAVRRKIWDVDAHEIAIEIHQLLIEVIEDGHTRLHVRVLPVAG